MSVNTRDIEKQLRHLKLKMKTYYEKTLVFKKHNFCEKKTYYGYFSKKKTEYEFSFSL